MSSPVAGLTELAQSLAAGDDTEAALAKAQAVDASPGAVAALAALAASNREALARLEGQTET